MDLQRQSLGCPFGPVSSALKGRFLFEGSVNILLILFLLLVFILISFSDCLINCKLVQDQDKEQIQKSYIQYRLHCNKNYGTFSKYNCFTKVSLIVKNVRLQTQIITEKKILLSPWITIPMKSTTNTEVCTEKKISLSPWITIPATSAPKKLG